MQPSLKSLIDQALKDMLFSPVVNVLPELDRANEGAIKDVLDTKNTAYYQWTPCFFDLIKPRQIIELGSAMGVWDILVLSSLPKDTHLYGISLEEHGLEFSYVKKEKYPNFHPIVGDDLNLNLWPKDLDLSKTDVWFFDSDHTESQLRKELELYKPFFKKDSIILFDDMELNPGMKNVLDDLENILPIKDKILNKQLHWSGFTICQIK